MGYPFTCVMSRSGAKEGRSPASCARHGARRKAREPGGVSNLPDDDRRAADETGILRGSEHPCRWSRRRDCRQSRQRSKRNRSELQCTCRHQSSIALIAQCAGPADGYGRTSGASCFHLMTGIGDLLCCSPLDDVNAGVEATRHIAAPGVHVRLCARPSRT
jgi:hypothetical protein